MALDATREGMDRAQGLRRLAEGDQQQRQVFAQKQEEYGQSQEVEKYKRGAKLAGMLLAAPEGPMRDQLWQQVAPQFNSMGMPVPDRLTPDMMPLVKQFYDIYGGASQNGQLPADIQTMEYYKANPDQFDRQLELRRAAANQFGFMEVEGKDGVKRVIQTNKREGGAATIGPGGVPEGAGAGPQGVAPQGDTPNIMDFATQAQRVLGGRITSGYRTPKEQADLRAAGKTTTVNSQHNDSTGVDMVFPNPKAKAQAIAFAKANGINAKDEGNHVHFGIPRGVDVAGPNAYASRPAEVQAGLTTAAQEAAETAALPEQERIKADTAIDQAASIERNKGAIDRENVATKRTLAADDSLMLLDEAVKILPDATGSLAGSVRDSVAGAAGYATGGAKASARLRVIAGYLVSKVPRMEGPQSNFDVQNYKEMAGDLGNEKLPVETRIEAARGMVRLQQKYASKPAAAGGKQVKRTGTHGGRKVVEYTDGTVSYAD